MKTAAALASAIVLVGAGAYFLLQRDAERSATKSSPARRIAVQPRGVPASMQSPPMKEADPSTQPADSVRPPVSSLAEGEVQLKNVLLAHVTMRDRFLNLTLSEQEKLTTVFLAFEAQKAELEKRHLKVDPFDGATLRLRIGAYPAEGRALRDAFYNQLRSDFSGKRFEQIDDHLGNFFDDYFKGFGTMAQELTIARAKYNGSSDELGRLYNIRWTATAVGDLTPSGVPQKDGRTTALSGSARLSYEAIRTGEYQYLVGPITSALPPVR